LCRGKVDNIYFGDGLKFTERTYCPPPLLPGAAEYKFGPEISEIEDPSVEEEQEWLRKLEVKNHKDGSYYFKSIHTRFFVHF